MSSDAQVVAGVGGLNRQVSRAKIAATSDQLADVGAGELVVTSIEALLDDGEAWEHLLGRLERFQRSSLILTFGGGTNEIQRDMIAMLALGQPYRR